MPPKAVDTSQTFSFDTVAVLVATMMANGLNLGTKEFKRMSALDGTRGEHGFNHMFRAVKTRAKELNDQAKDSGEMTPVKKTKATGTTSAKKANGASATGKRVRKTSKDEDAAGDNDEQESPSKKVKAEVEEDGDGDDEDVVKPNYEFEF